MTIFIIHGSIYDGWVPVATDWFSVDIGINRCIKMFECNAEISVIVESITDKQPKIIVLVGLPGSGKSFYRDKLLCTHIGADFVIISSDDEIEALCAEAGLTYSEGFEQFIGKGTHIMKQKFRDAVNNDRNIIWDQTNLTPKKRRGILKQVPHTYFKEAIAVEVTIEELEERLARREKETGKHIPTHVVNSMAQSYLPPTKEEGFDTVTILK